MIAARSGEVCVVGSINLDLMARVDRLPAPGETLLGEWLGRFPGGKGFNQAVAARRSGAVTRFCGAVGNDSAGSFLTTVAKDAGVDTTRLAVVADVPTGVARIYALPGSENSIVVIPGANAALPVSAVTTAIDGAGVVLVQLETPTEVAQAALAGGRRAGAITILNAAPATVDAVDLLDRVDVLVVNEAEAEALGGAARCLDLGAGCVVVTLGARGCELYRAESDRLVFGAFSVAAIDTTGAGDAFCGALAAALASGEELPQAIRRAGAAGAITACAVGAQTEELTPEAIARLVAV